METFWQIHHCVKQQSLDVLGMQETEHDEVFSRGP